MGFYSVVGSPHYMAPEIINLSPNGYGKEVDWWSLGCLIFEMVTGNPPFEGRTPQEVFDNISNWKIKLPKILSEFRQYLSEQFIDLISGFLCEPEKRLGNDIDVFKIHTFFTSVDWDNLRSNKPLFIPHLENQFDISYFENKNQSTPTKTHRFSRYYKKCLKKTEQCNTSLQVQLQRLHRSRSFDSSELRSHNILSWVTPLKQRNKRFSHEQSADNMVVQIQLHTPLKDSPITPTSDKQILGFTFQRKQSCRVLHIDSSMLPSFHLSTVEIEEQNEEMIDI